jgi:hypothetical protein
MKIYRTSTQGHAREKKMMLPEMHNIKRSAHYLLKFFAAAVVFMILTLAGISADAASKQKGFASAEEAVKAAVAAVKSDNDKEVLAIFGAEAKEVMSSGDPVSDKQRRERFISAYDQKNSLAKEGEKMVLVVGENDWPFPIPLVKKENQWFFDTKAGKEEILNRRIGQNELFTIQTMLAAVDAQREYAMNDRDNDGLLEYAQKFLSDPGKKNGLYWQTKEGEDPSPLGEFVANARAEGYTRKDKPVPYHGYYYRLLKAQGPNAPDGAYDYLVKGSMIGGFAVLAYPAEYGNSGVMTFMVNHDGVVYQKDLGRNTATTAKAMKKFDPDKSWKKIEQ